MLIVGVGGNNGVTLLAGKIANRDNLSWEGAPPAEIREANLLGCITQLGGQCGFKDDYPLAKFVDAVVGGWDIRSTPLGSALYNSRVLDYDLVRQVQVSSLSLWLVTIFVNACAVLCLPISAVFGNTLATRNKLHCRMS